MAFVEDKFNVSCSKASLPSKNGVEVFNEQINATDIEMVVKNLR